MNKELKQVLPLLTGASNPTEVPAEKLQALADRYPYFSAVQLLLLQKMKDTGDAGLQKQLLKTALHFPNEQWLRYLLSEPTEEVTEPVIEAVVHPEANASPDKTQPAADNEEADSEADISNTTFASAENINLITLPAEAILQDIPDIETIKSEPEEMPLDDEELLQQSEPLPIEESNQKIASLLSGQAEEFHKPVEEKAEILVSTEPFHTVDYFASQGIGLDAKREDNTFDKKVHKFTDWLRQMKRINPHPADLGTETEEETAVASIADSSNYTKAILTESMADVLLKQGKQEKAVEIYQKLSLLNPDKSTYFAALIQNIK